MSRQDQNSPLDRPPVVRAVTVIMAVVIGLTFMFGFGNVLSLALHLGVPVWVAPLVAPAVDLSILGLLLGIRHLALTGATPDNLRSARRLLMFASVVSLALNVADPMIMGDYGKAAFDAVGPLLLIGWAEVGPGFLQAMSISCGKNVASSERASTDVPTCARDEDDDLEQRPVSISGREVAISVNQQTVHGAATGKDDLLERAMREDARHWAINQRPISAETLRKRLRIGAARARILVSTIRADHPGPIDAGS